MDLIGWVGVGLGGAYGCKCGILYAPMLGVVVYAGLVSLPSFSHILQFFLLNSPHHIVTC